MATGPAGRRRPGTASSAGPGFDPGAGPGRVRTLRHVARDRLRIAGAAARFDDVMFTTWQSTTRFVDAHCGATNTYALVGDMQPQEQKLRHQHPVFITHNR